MLFLELSLKYVKSVDANSRKKYEKILTKIPDKDQRIIFNFLNAEKRLNGMFDHFYLLS